MQLIHSIYSKKTFLVSVKDWISNICPVTNDEEETTKMKKYLNNSVTITRHTHKIQHLFRTHALEKWFYHHYDTIYTFFNSKVKLGLMLVLPENREARVTVPLRRYSALDILSYKMENKFSEILLVVTFYNWSITVINSFHDIRIYLTSYEWGCLKHVTAAVYANQVPFLTVISLFVVYIMINSRKSLILSTTLTTSEILPEMLEIIIKHIQIINLLPAKRHFIPS